jgi:hypothetical protein
VALRARRLVRRSFHGGSVRNTIAAKAEPSAWINPGKPRTEVTIRIAEDILSVAEQGFFGIAGSAGIAMNSTGSRKFHLSQKTNQTKQQLTDFNV